MPPTGAEGRAELLLPLLPTLALVMFLWHLLGRDGDEGGMTPCHPTLMCFTVSQRQFLPPSTFYSWPNFAESPGRKQNSFMALSFVKDELGKINSQTESGGPNTTIPTFHLTVSSSSSPAPHHVSAPTIKHFVSVY